MAANKPLVHVTEPALLIRIGQLYRPGMGGVDLYEATQGCFGDIRKRREIAYGMHWLSMTALSTSVADPGA